MAETQPITVSDARGALHLVFSEAKTSQERARCVELASTAFGKSLSREGYLERDELLNNLPIAQGNGLRFWSLTRPDEPESVLATCKTMHRDLLVRDDGAASGAPKVSREQGYCICSVVTDSSYRGRGLATILLKSVAEWLDGPGQATASMLYSDVGDFYVSKGWALLDAFQSVLSVPASIPPREKLRQLPETRLLTADDIPRLCERDVEILKDEFQKCDPLPGEVLMTVLPTANLVTWLQARIDFTNANTNSRAGGNLPEAKGSICESADSWIYWCHDPHNRKLTAQRIRLPRGQSEAATTKALARLLLDALEEAAKWELLEVVVWNPGPELRGAMEYLRVEFGIEVRDEKRESKNIPCLRWRGGEKKSVIVSPNEYYAWS